MNLYLSFSQFFLRLALSVGFVYPGLDRFGIWGANGAKGVTWGDWQHFSAYAHKLMYFLPSGLADLLGIVATVAELGLGFCLLLGLFTQWAAFGSGVLTLVFGVCMVLALGFYAPINYAVFVSSAASFLLASMPYYKWSLDAIQRK